MRLELRPLTLALLLAAAPLGGCTGTAPPAPTELAPHQIAQVPDGVTRTLVDFGGKLHLVGYEVTPARAAGPGDTVTVKLYWRVAGQLDRGFQLFTHLEDERGRQLWNYDREGAFRRVLGALPGGLAAVPPGTLLLDEQTLTLPKAEQLAPRVVLVVGAWKKGKGDLWLRLPVLSGPSNGRSGGVIATLETPVPRRSPPPPGAPQR
ncbi:MAG: hypothetical protein FJ104_03700 [Deltaproteobacteria bacterium]|nr:hypothetical protein [Deltaproteobacteria bacterium]